MSSSNTWIRAIRIDVFMSDDKPEPQFLELPGEPTLWRTTNLPPRRIELPCFRRFPQSRLWLILLILGPVVFAGWGLVIMAVVRFEALLDGKPDGSIKALFFLIALLPLLILGSEAILMTLRSMFHRGDHAGFDAERLWHFQLSDPVAFRTIEKLEIFYVVGPYGFTFPAFLRITTAQPARLRFSSLFNRRRRSLGGGSPRFVFSPRSMSPDADLLTDAMGHLVTVHGGVVVKRRNFLFLFLGAFS